MRRYGRITEWLAMLLVCAVFLSGIAAAAKITDFTDVPQTAWYARQLEYALAHDLTNGTSARTFSPEKSMTRAQFVTFLARAMNGSGTNDGTFGDVPAGAYYTSAVYWAASHELVNGVEPGVFAPDKEITRQEMITMIGRAVEKLELELPDVKSPVAGFSDLKGARAYALPYIELLRKKGLVTGYTDGRLFPNNQIKRSEGIVMIVRLMQALDPGSAVAAPSVNGALAVDGTRLVDQHGNPVQLRGVSTHGLAWYPQYVNQALFTQLRQNWGANVVRLAMYTAEYNGYCTGGSANQQTLKQLIRAGVEYAVKADLYAIVDWHILSDGDPAAHQSEAIAFFREMSREFAANNNVLYEICNEPNGGVSWSRIKAYAEQVIPVIRANDPDAVIIVGTPTWSQDVDQAAADPIRGQKNIMYALHYYAATHRQELRKKMTDAISKGLPVFVTEYGICDASGSGAVDLTSANEWVSTMNQYGVSYVCWNLSNKNETSALIRPECAKTSGFSESDLSESGRWLLDTLAGPGFDGSAPPQDDPGGTQTPPAAQEATGKTGAIAWSAQCTQMWGSGAETYYQYSLQITNTGSAACEGWRIQLTFQDTPTLDQIWCASGSVSGKTLNITNADFNARLEPGQSIDNVGMIVKGSASLRIAAE